MDFEKICMLFTMQEPYYGILLSAMNRVPTNRIDTLAVTQSGNVFKLYYNPNFVGQFDVDTTIQLLKHEVLHCAFNHFTIWDGENKNDSEQMHQLRNIAEDLEVNSYLDRSKMQKEAGGVWPEDLGYDKFEGTREYLKKLLQKNKQQQQAKQPQMPCNGGLRGNSEDEEEASSSTQSQSQSQPQQQQQSQTQSQPSSSQCSTNQQSSSSRGSGGSNSGDDISDEFLDEFNTFDDHSLWPKEQNDGIVEQMKQAVEDLLLMAEEECKKGRGTVPGEMVGRLEQIKSRKKPKPVADWKRYCRRYLGNEFSEFIRKSKKRESRRFPDAAGNRHRRKSMILVAVDTSGSVSMPEYREFFGQIKTLTATSDFHVLECDSIIQYEYDFKGKPSEILHGGGGTDFSPVIEYYIKNKKKYDALVYFTDGYCDIPSNTPKETLWVISSNGDQSDRKKYKVNGASVAFIPKQTK